MMTKNPVRKIKNLIVNHESQPIKLSSAKLGLAATLILLVWPMKKAGFSLANFFDQSNFLQNFHLLATFVEVKKVGSNNPIFYCF